MSATKVEPNSVGDKLSAGSPVSQGSWRRIGWLVVLLIAVAVVAWWRRDWLARIPNAYARAEIAKHNERKGIEWLDFSKRLSSENPDTEFLYGRALRHLGQLDDADRHYRRSKFLGMSEELLSRERILINAQSGQLSDAEKHLPELASNPMGDETEICEAYVIGYLRNHQFSGAEPLLEAWLRDHPDDAQAYYWRGLLNRELYFQGRFDEKRAEQDFNKALELNPNHHRAAYAYGELLSEKLQMQDAVRLFQIARQSPDLFADASVQLAKCLRNTDEPAQARKVLEEAIASDPNSDEAAQELASLAVEDGDYPTAIKYLEPALNRNPSDKDLRYLLGVSLRGQGKPEEAKKHLDFASKATEDLSKARDMTTRLGGNPKDPDARYEIGIIYLKYGMTKRAMIWLESALDCEPNHVPTHRALADYYQRKAAVDPKFAELAQAHASFLASVPGVQPNSQQPPSVPKADN